MKKGVVEINSKGHFIVSLIKSFLRIIGTITTLYTSNIEFMCVLFLSAEILGIAEEFLDKR